MLIKPTISFEQYKAALQALSNAKTPRAAVARTTRRVRISAGLISLSVFALTKPAYRPALILGCIVAWVFLVACRWWSKRSRNRCLRMIYNEELPQLSGQELLVDETGIGAVSMSGLATSHHAWRSFIGCIDLPDAFLFLPSPNSFIRLPRGTSSGVDEEQLLVWSADVPKRKP